MSRYSFLLVVLGSVLWGTDSLFRRPLSQDLSPITIVFLEHCILVLVLSPWLLRSGRSLGGLHSRDWGAMAFIAVGGSVAATSLFTFAIKYGNPSVTVLLQKAQPFFTAFLARWLLRERTGRHFWYCLFPALIGAYLVSSPDWRSGFLLRENQPSCIAAALGAALLWGSCTVLGRYIVVRLPVIILTGFRFLLALPVLAVLFASLPNSQMQLPSAPESILGLLAMALIPGLAALVFYYRGLQSTLAANASIAELAFPVTAVALNWLFLGIGLTESQIVGAGLLVGAVTVLTYLNARFAEASGSERHARGDRLSCPSGDLVN